MDSFKHKKSLSLEKDNLSQASNPQLAGGSPPPGKKRCKKEDSKSVEPIIFESVAEDSAPPAQVQMKEPNLVNIERTGANEGDLAGKTRTVTLGSFKSNNMMLTSMLVMKELSDDERKSEKKETIEVENKVNEVQNLPNQVIQSSVSSNHLSKQTSLKERLLDYLLPTTSNQLPRDHSFSITLLILGISHPASGGSSLIISDSLYYTLSSRSLYNKLVPSVDPSSLVGKYIQIVSDGFEVQNKAQPSQTVPGVHNVNVNFEVDLKVKSIKMLDCERSTYGSEVIPNEERHTVEEGLMVLSDGFPPSGLAFQGTNGLVSLAQMTALERLRAIPDLPKVDFVAKTLNFFIMNESRRSQESQSIHNRSNSKPSKPTSISVKTKSNPLSKKSGSKEATSSSNSKTGTDIMREMEQNRAQNSQANTANHVDQPTNQSFTREITIDENDNISIKSHPAHLSTQSYSSLLSPPPLPSVTIAPEFLSAQLAFQQYQLQQQMALSLAMNQQTLEHSNSMRSIYSTHPIHPYMNSQSSQRSIPGMTYPGANLINTSNTQSSQSYQNAPGANHPQSSIILTGLHSQKSQKSHSSNSNNISQPLPKPGIVNPQTEPLDPPLEPLKKTTVIVDDSVPSSPDRGTSLQKTNQTEEIMVDGEEMPGDVGDIREPKDGHDEDELQIVEKNDGFTLIEPEQVLNNPVEESHENILSSESSVPLFGEGSQEKASQESLKLVAGNSKIQEEVPEADQLPDSMISETQALNAIEKRISFNKNAPATELQIETPEASEERQIGQNEIIPLPSKPQGVSLISPAQLQALLKKSSSTNDPNQNVESKKFANSALFHAPILPEIPKTFGDLSKSQKEAQSSQNSEKDSKMPTSKEVLEESTPTISTMAELSKSMETFQNELSMLIGDINVIYAQADNQDQEKEPPEDSFITDQGNETEQDRFRRLTEDKVLKELEEAAKRRQEDAEVLQSEKEEQEKQEKITKYIEDVILYINRFGLPETLPADLNLDRPLNSYERRLQQRRGLQTTPNSNTKAQSTIVEEEFVKVSSGSSQIQKSQQRNQNQIIQPEKEDLNKNQGKDTDQAPEIIPSIIEEETTTRILHTKEAPNLAEESKAAAKKAEINLMSILSELRESNKAQSKLNEREKSSKGNSQEELVEIRPIQIQDQEQEPAILIEDEDSFLDSHKSSSQNDKLGEVEQVSRMEDKFGMLTDSQIEEKNRQNQDKKERASKQSEADENKDGPKESVFLSLKAKEWQNWTKMSSNNSKIDRKGKQPKAYSQPNKLGDFSEQGPEDLFSAISLYNDPSKVTVVRNQEGEGNQQQSVENKKTQILNEEIEDERNPQENRQARLKPSQESNSKRLSRPAISGPTHEETHSQKKRTSASLIPSAQNYEVMSLEKSPSKQKDQDQDENSQLKEEILRSFNKPFSMSLDDAENSSQSGLQKAILEDSDKEASQEKLKRTEPRKKILTAEQIMSLEPFQDTLLDTQIIENKPFHCSVKTSKPESGYSSRRVMRAAKTAYSGQNIVLSDETVKTKPKENIVSSEESTMGIPDRKFGFSSAMNIKAQPISSVMSSTDLPDSNFGNKRGSSSFVIKASSMSQPRDLNRFPKTEQPSPSLDPSLNHHHPPSVPQPSPSPLPQPSFHPPANPVQQHLPPANPMVNPMVPPVVPPPVISTHPLDSLPNKTEILKQLFLEFTASETNLTSFSQKLASVDESLVKKCLVDILHQTNFGNG